MGGEPVIGGLYRVRASGVGAAYLKPGATFHGYDSVVIDPVVVSYKGDSAASEPAGMDRLKRIFQESFASELARSDHFTLATEAGPGTLRISGYVVEVVIDSQPPPGRDIDLVMGGGEMTLILDVRDSQTGEPFARLADRRAIRPKSAGLSLPYKNTPVKTWGAMRDIVSDWARVLRHLLEDVREPPDAPLPAAPGE